MMTTTQQPSTKEDILQYLLKQGQATAQEMAQYLGISPQAIRRHLKDLQAAGSIDQQVAGGRGTGQTMGRPQYLYQLSRQGRDRFGNSHAEFAVSLLDTLAETVGQDQVSSILRKQWERKAKVYRDRLSAGSLRERVATLVELRKAEGYMAEWHPVETDGTVPEKSEKAHSSRFILVEHNCAIADVASSFPTVCGHELEMFAAVLPDCLVERTQWIIDGEHRCGYLISPRSEEQAESA
ncbi:MAG: iron-sulfur cluster biosynthesis transcriptional regulator SufR [Hormoscilla sp. GUM202]|nr:iron-sulfur cluster biosynthesis transcriptional regulator SufR [Hormoscilla sp. GUM202]